MESTSTTAEKNQQHLIFTPSQKGYYFYLFLSGVRL